MDLSADDGVEVEWDFLVISNIAYNYDDKRTFRIMDKPGRRLLIGMWRGRAFMYEYLY